MEGSFVPGSVLTGYARVTDRFLHPSILQTMAPTLGLESSLLSFLITPVRTPIHFM